jgi:hypothetical protein
MDQSVPGDSAAGWRFGMGCVAAITLVLATITDPFGDMTAWADGALSEALPNMTYPSEWTRSSHAQWGSLCVARRAVGQGQRARRKNYDPS